MSRKESKKDAGGERMTVLHNVARSLVSMVRSSGIRKDFVIDDDHGVPPFKPTNCKRAKSL